MIEIEKLTDNDKGRMVIYKKGLPHGNEEGVITSWNNTYIFVCYGNDKGSKATRPEDLCFSIK